MKIAASLALASFVSSVSSTVVEVVEEKENLSTLFGVLEAADVVETLKGDGPFTVFAPTNDAFAEMDQDTLKDYTTKDEWFAHVRALALYHVAGGEEFMSDAFTGDGKVVNTLLVNQITERLENITITSSDLVEGEVDLDASNGVVHSVSKVFMLTHMTRTLMELATEIPGFGQVSVLFASVPGLEDTLTNDIVTIFAPNEDAIASIGAVAGGEIQLDQVILNHMVQGLFPSPKLTDGTELTSLAEQPLTITVEGDEIKVNDAVIEVFDAVASNGVIHGITAVMLVTEEEAESP